MAEVFKFPAPAEVGVVRKALVLAKHFEETEASLVSTLDLIRRLIDETQTNDATRQLSEQREIILKALAAAREAFDRQLRVLLGHDAEASDHSTGADLRDATTKKIKFVNELTQLIEGLDTGIGLAAERDEMLTGLRSAKSSFEQQLEHIDQPRSDRP